MAERKVSVRITASGGSLGRELDELAVEATAASAAIRGIPNKVTVRGDTRGIDQIEQRARRAERSSSALVDTLTALWPAMIPVATLGVPAIAGLAAQTGFAVAGIGTMVLAFHGLGDALKALNAYQLDPTVQNLEKAQKAVDALGPAGARFAIELQHLSPVLKQLKQDAGSGLFPGAIEGIDSLLTRLPQLQRILRTISSVEGDALADLGKGIASPELDDFFSYLETDAKPIMTDMAGTIGHLAAGFAHLFVDLAPQERAFSDLLLRGSRDFDKWAAGLDRTKGFQEFMDYVEQTGPEVGHALGSIGSALLDVAKAGAPLGGVTLHALADLADIVDRIAKSPVGTPLIALASGLALVNRAMAVSALAKNSLVSDLIYGKVGDDGTRGANAIGRVRGGIQGLVTDLRTARSLPGIKKSFGLPTAAELEAQAAATGRLRGQIGGLAKGGAAIGALALATSGVAQSTGLANTASLALAGTLVGPWGVAVGAGVGLLQDLAGANNDVETAASSANRAFKSGTYAEQATALASLNNQLDTYKQKVGAGQSVSSLLFKPQSLGTTVGAIGEAFSNTVNEQTANQKRLQTELANTTSSYRALAQQLGMPLPANATPEQIQQFADKVQPALDAAGVSAKQFGNLGYAGIQRVVSAYRDYEASTTSSAAQTQQVKSILMSTTLSADQLASALDSLFSPKLNRAAATDAFTKSVQALKTQLKGAAGLTGDSAGALNNRAAIQSTVSALNAKIKADADAGASSAKLTADLVRGRKAILDQGAAAGISRAAMRQYLNTLGLTPELVKSVVKLDGADKANDKSGTLLSTLRTLIGLPTVKPSVDVRVSGKPLLQSVHDLVFGLDGKHSTSFVQTVFSTVGKPPGNAAGGRMHGPGTKTSDSIPAMLSTGEGVVRAAAMDHYDRRFGSSWFEDINAMRFAAGGRVKKHKKQPRITLNSVVAASAGVSLAQLQAEDAIAEDQSQIDDLVSQLNAQKLVGKKGHKHYVYATVGDARTALEAQLRVAVAQLAQDRAALANGTYSGGPNDGAVADAVDSVSSTVDEAAQQRAQDQQTAYQTLSAAGDIFANGNSAAGAVRSVQKTIAQIQAFGAAAKSLYDSGANRLLLKQIVDHAMNTGDFAGSTALAKSLLAQPLLLGQLNYELSTLDSLATGVANQVTDPSFLTGSTAAVSATTAAASVQQVAVLQVSANPDEWMSELERRMIHRLDTLFTQALPG